MHQRISMSEQIEFCLNTDSNDHVQKSSHIIANFIKRFYKIKNIYNTGGTMIFLDALFKCIR